MPSNNGDSDRSLIAPAELYVEPVEKDRREIFTRKKTSVTLVSPLAPLDSTKMKPGGLTLNIINFGEKTPLHPYGYGYCTCGCGTRTKQWKGFFAIYAEGHNPHLSGPGPRYERPSQPHPSRRRSLSPRPSPLPQRASSVYNASVRGLFQLQLPSFTGDASLPLTMDLAESFEEAVRPLLHRIDPDYSSDDRVLAWICPRLRPDIRRYYRGNSPCLRELVTPEALDALDKRLCWKLGRRLEQAYPRFLGWLSRRAER